MSGDLLPPQGSPRANEVSSLPALGQSPRVPVGARDIRAKVQFYALQSDEQPNSKGLVQKEIQDPRKQEVGIMLTDTQRLIEQRQRRCTPYPVKASATAVVFREADTTMVSFHEDEGSEDNVDKKADRLEKQRQRRCTPYPVKQQPKEASATATKVLFQEDEGSEDAIDKKAERLERQRQRRCTPYPVKASAAATKVVFREADTTMVSFHEDAMVSFQEDEGSEDAIDKKAERLERQRQRRCTPYPVKQQPNIASSAATTMVSFQEEERNSMESSMESSMEEDPRVEGEKVHKGRHRRCTPLPVRLHEQKGGATQSLAMLGESDEEGVVEMDEEGGEGMEQEGLVEVEQNEEYDGDGSEEAVDDEMPIVVPLQQERAGMIKTRQQRRCTPMPVHMSKQVASKRQQAPLQEPNGEVPLVAVMERRPSGWAALCEL
jgi:hypothetical protein